MNTEHVWSGVYLENDLINVEITISLTEKEAESIVRGGFDEDIFIESIERTLKSIRELRQRSKK